jgi:hypothetical protein
VVDSFGLCLAQKMKVTFNHFDIDCLYHRQGNEQKQVAVHQFKIPINQDTSLLKKSLSISKYLYPFKRVSTLIRR